MITLEVKKHSKQLYQVKNKYEVRQKHLQS